MGVQYLITAVRCPLHSLMLSVRPLWLLSTETLSCVLSYAISVKCNLAFILEED